MSGPGLNGRSGALNALTPDETGKNLVYRFMPVRTSLPIIVIIAVGKVERMEVNPRILKWFANRGINPENVKHTGIYSGRHQQDGDKWQVVPDETGEVVVFPYRRKGAVVNEKYRAANKRFYQMPGGKKVFWNADILDDPALHEGRASLIITEGEMDALAVMEAGNPFVVSVPDGAPPAPGGITEVPEGMKAQDVIPEFDTKYGYIFNDWDSLKKIKRIIIATDNDEPGRRLAEELVRRLGRARCSFVVYPEGCKDFNEVLMKGDMATIGEMIARAQPYPVSGVYTYSELPEEPPLNPASTGFGRLDDYLKPFYPALMVVTGFAGSGKSSFVNQMVGQLNLQHGWKVAIASFEMRIKPFVTGVLTQTYLEAGNDVAVQDEWLDENFMFIAPEPSEEDESFDIDWLIEKATVAVIRHGIRVLVIDPWNEIEHASRKGESLTDYTGRAIRALKRFGREFECLVIVVAHPTKNAATKAPEEVTLYDVSDSAHWANKADFGIVVARRGESEHDFVSSVFVKKVRYQPISGRPGSIELTYDPVTRTFGQ